MIKRLLLTPAILFLVACGGGTKAAQTVEVNQKSEEKEIKTPYASSVAAMLSEKSRTKEAVEIDACTAFLTENDIMVTNAHCIPRKFAGDTCSEIKFKFMAVNGLPEEDVICEKVVFRSAPRDHVFKKVGIIKDYAYLKIKKTTRPALPISYEGAGDKESLTVVGINFPKNRMEVKSCYSKQGTYNYPSNRQNVFSIMQLNNCTTIEGNSGSPVINASGKVVGIVSNSINKSKTGITGSIEVRNEPKRDASFATSFACAWEPTLTREHGASLKECRLETDSEINALIDSELSGQFNKQVQNIKTEAMSVIEKNSSLIVWGLKLEQANNAYNFNSAPLCVDMDSSSSRGRTEQVVSAYRIYVYTDTDYMMGIATDSIKNAIEFNVLDTQASGSLMKYRVASYNLRTGERGEHSLFGCDKLSIFKQCRLNPSQCKLFNF